MISPSLALKIVREEPHTIAYDTETSGLTFGRDYVVGYVITNSEHSIYVPVRHEGGGNIPDAAEFEAALADAFAERSRRGFRTVGHNLNFDLTMGAQHGVVPGAPLEDTQINEGLIDDNTTGYGLDDCAERHNVVAKRGAELYAELARRYGGLPDRKTMAHFWRLPGDHPLVVDYSIGDGITTLQLWAKQQPLIDEQELRTVWKLECDLIPYVAKMRIKGIRIREEAGQGVIEGLDEDIKVAKGVLPPGFNARSPKEVEALFRANGYQDADFARTDTGKPSFTEKWLDGNPIGNAMLDVRRLEKAKGSFVLPLIQEFNIGGRVHANLNQSRSDEYGTNTGRFSCSEPNLQAIPKRNYAIGKRVRKVLGPDEDMLLGEADFKQQEPRLFAHYSEDENLLGGYLATPPKDIHTTASELLHKERDTAKRLGMGMLTGMQPPTLAMHMGYTLAEAEADHRAFLRDAFPRIGQFQKKAKTVATNRGYIKTILGRRARFPSAKWAYKATSRIIQGSGADHMKLALLRAHQYAESLPANELDILMTIHDSNMFQFRRGADHVKDELCRVVEAVAQELQLLVPIPVDCGIGEDWAEASYGK